MLIWQKLIIHTCNSVNFSQHRGLQDTGLTNVAYISSFLRPSVLSEIVADAEQPKSNQRQETWKLFSLLNTVYIWL